MADNKRWIRCRVRSGMFSDERTVEVEGESFFVEQRSARNVQSDGTGEVEVTIVKDGDREWAVLPTNYRDSVMLGA